jgi:hypothetical protein
VSALQNAVTCPGRVRAARRIDHPSMEVAPNRNTLTLAV